MSDYFLLFSSHFDRDRGLDYGRLSLNSLSKGTIDIWIATSSVATKQGAESFHMRGGLLPPQYRCPQLKNWTVETLPIPREKTWTKSDRLPYCKGKKRDNFSLSATNPFFSINILFFSSKLGTNEPVKIFTVLLLSCRSKSLNKG